MSKITVTEKDYSSHRVETMGVHAGNLIWENIHVNRKASQVVVELAQNALDENAKHLHIIIDAKRRILWAYDDGDGVTEDEILALWKKIGTSSKRDKAGKVGWKGIAKLANLAIAEWNTFISRPRVKHPGALYFKIAVDKSQIWGKDEPPIDVYRLKQGFGFGDAVSFKATTMVRLDGLQKGALAEFSDPQTIADEIGKAFAREIRSRQTDIQILYYPEGTKGKLERVFARPKDYEGTRQKPMEIKTPYGPVSFFMTTTRFPVKHPELVIDYLNPRGGMWSFDLQNVPGILDKRDVADALASGHFQGRIEVGFCTLVPDRQGFIDDEQRDAFVHAVLTYVYDWARPYVAHLKSEASAEREEKILQAEETRLNDLFAENPGLALDGELRTFFPGGLPAKKPVVKGKEKKPSPPAPPIDAVVRPPAPKVPAGGQKKPPTAEVKPPRRPPKTTPHKKEAVEEETHMGLKIVRKLANQEPRFSGPTWAKAGTIYFNVEHAFWIAAAQKGDKPLAAYVHEHSCKEIAAMMTGDNDRARDAFLEIFDEKFSRLTTLMRD